MKKLRPKSVSIGTRAGSGVNAFSKRVPLDCGRSKPDEVANPPPDWLRRLFERRWRPSAKVKTPWSTRGLAEAHGVNASTVCRLWQEHQLKPHRQETFQLSRDQEFVPKLLDVVGVYLNPPPNAVVLCIDEKSQIQALDRTQPGWPRKRGRGATWTHDHVRHGTTTLFAAWEVAPGKVGGECYPQHRHQEFLQFLKRLEAGYPEEVELPLVLDHDCPHQHERGKRWLARHPRVKPHFIPTSSSWMNLVERWLAELTGKAVRRGNFSSVPSLIAAVVEFIEQWNQKPKPLVWTAKAEDILAKIQRCQRRLEQIKPGGTQARSGRAKARKQGLVVYATQH